MLELLRSIVDLIVGFITFIINTLVSIFDLIKMIPNLITFVGSILASMPSFVIPFITLSITIMVLIFIKQITEV